MNTKDFIKIINEEIQKFDFLSNDKFLKEQEINELLLNEDLQKQFICDSLLNKKDRVKIARIVDFQIGSDWDENNIEDANSLSLEYSLDMEYIYDSQKEPLKFNLYFQADRINISVGGWHDQGRFGGTTDTDYPPEGELWYDSFDWTDIDVSLWTMDGDKIPFIAFEKAPSRIQILFIREYTQNFIEDETLEFRTREVKDNVQNTGYC